MGRKAEDFTPFRMMALGWALPAAFAGPWLRGFGAMQARPANDDGMAGTPDADTNDPARLTPKEQVLLLHILE